MFIIRLLALILLTALSFGMGQTPANQLNEVGTFVAASFFLLAPALYFYPMYEAYFNKQPNFYSIFALNLFLGWTLVGWVVALVWALKSQEPVKTAVVSTPDVKPVTPQPAPVSPPSPAKQMKQCPYCAEDILMAAKKCKHCGSEV
ncbi:superinfection immunity protein [Shewanella sp. SM87]|uniref:superinfection immunity protein n=1 Tax=Shewanella sp. SM87 TaxID=2912808 RepID=UPI0021D92165|nr:superinfection immunity protein [Shewanella sp. SM87]MCU8008470.1 superinfection immunity protein [Shewanella sp. SM87]